MKILPPLLAFLMGGCVSLPDNIKPVTNLDAERYLGTWYEIARLDHSFERGLEQVTATYTLRDDGGITVTNKGFKTEAGKWKEATGRAYFVGARDVAFLKVSFFRPFYAPYVIFDISEDYRTAYVSSDGEDTLWFLARTPVVGQKDKERFLATARKQGFNLTDLIWVPQARPTALFDRLGGKAPIAAIASDFVDAVMPDADLHRNPAIARASDKVPADYIKIQLTMYFCQHSGGHCQHRGRTVREALAPLKFRETDWDRSVTLFKDTLDQHRIAAAESQELLAIYSSMKRDAMGDGPRAAK